MYKITVKGEAQTDYENLKELNGVDCQDNFAEYFDSDATYADAIKAGYMDFRFENGKLFTYTVYTSNRELTPIELEDLKVNGRTGLVRDSNSIHVNMTMMMKFMYLHGFLVKNQPSHKL